ncbi:DUF1010 domain-containing protein [Acidovorax sp. LjRoot66]|uniref:DUF1010 domain-containing protein n=1 Tax=Acidovorax sp. LjRoot66 TaxID=3342334 RepID=UPI003F509AB0
MAGASCYGFCSVASLRWRSAFFVDGARLQNMPVRRLGQLSTSPVAEGLRRAHCRLSPHPRTSRSIRAR